jgi:hypothetical protein
MKKDRHRLTGLTGLLLFVALVFGLGWSAIHAMTLEAPAWVQKLASADRVINYVVDHEQGPRIALAGDERVLKLITHAVMGHRDFAPEQTVSYGIAASLWSRGEKLWSAQLFTESRQSKARFTGEMWLDENAFTREGDLQLADDRTQLVVLPDAYPPGSEIHFRLLGQIDRAQIRIYKQQERDQFRREVIARALDLGDSREGERSSTYLPWQFVSELEQIGRVRYVFERMPAIGLKGNDYQTETTYYTGFRLPNPALDGSGVLTLTKGRAAAVNVVGPGELVLRFSVPTAFSGTTSFENKVSITRIGSGDPEAPLDVSYRSNGAENRRYRVPNGVSSLIFQNHGPGTAQISVGEFSALGFGLPPPPKLDERGSTPLLRSLRPDERRIPVYFTNSGLPPLEVETNPEADFFARALRIDVRTPFDGDIPLPLAPATTLTAEFVDANGTIVSRSTRTIQAPPSRIESIERIDVLDAGGDKSFRPVVVELGTSEASSLRVVPPGKAVRLRLSTDRPAHLRIFSYVPSDDLYESPYRDVELLGLKWHYAPLERRRWIPIRVENHTELLLAGRAATLVAHSRLEPTDPSHTADQPTTTLQPRGTPDQQEVLEPFAGPRSLAVRDWGESMVAGLSLHKPLAVRVPAESHTPPAIHYRVPSEFLGDTLVVQIDGIVSAEMILRTTRGTAGLSRLTPGEHSVMVTLRSRSSIRGTEEFVLLTNLPPRDSAPIFNLRKLYRLDGRGLRLTIQRKPEESLVVNAIIYADGKPANLEHEVDITLDGGTPRRSPNPSAYLTVPYKRVPLPAANRPHSASFLDRRGDAGFPRPIPIFVGDDLSENQHDIQIVNRQSKPLWARFFVSRRARPKADRVLQFGLSEEVDFDDGREDSE